MDNNPEPESELEELIRSMDELAKDCAPSDLEKLAKYENELLDCCLTLTSSLRCMLAQLDATKGKLSGSNLPKVAPPTE